MSTQNASFLARTNLTLISICSMCRTLMHECPSEADIARVRLARGNRKLKTPDCNCNICRSCRLHKDIDAMHHRHRHGRLSNTLSLKRLDKEFIASPCFQATGRGHAQHWRRSLPCMSMVFPMIDVRISCSLRGGPRMEICLERSGQVPLQTASGRGRHYYALQNMRQQYSRASETLSSSSFISVCHESFSSNGRRW